MKLSEFKQAISTYKDNEIGFDVNHFHSDIFLEVEYSTKSTVSNSTESAYIDYVYVDKTKHRIFYVGKSESRKSGIFSRKLPMQINAMKFFNWAEAENKYDDFEVYFAWNYDFKDESVFDYVPLSGSVKAMPSVRDLKKLVFTAEKGKTFKIRVRNLHENLQKSN